MGAGVEIRAITGAGGRRRFVDLPFRLFGDDPTWVPPLRMAVMDRLSPKHPANSHQQTALWMAWRDGRPVGRIGACVDSLFDDFQQQHWGWIGFFEAADDVEVAAALFDTACSWAAAHGAQTCVGPASFTTNDECGLQVDGFEHPPYLLTIQNPPYYERLWTAAGWEQAMDLWGWHLERSLLGLSERQNRLLKRLERRDDLRIRPVRMKDYNAEVSRVFDVYNAAWARNWGFAPMTEPEVRHLAKDLKQILDPDLALIAETPDGVPVGVAIALPDANEAMAGVRNGRLLPTGWWTLLRGVRRATRARVFALGVRPELQNRAVGLRLYGELLGRALAKSQYTSGEASWILSTNAPMNQPLEALGARRYKTWRMYQRPV